MFKFSLMLALLLAVPFSLQAPAPKTAPSSKIKKPAGLQSLPKPINKPGLPPAFPVPPSPPIMSNASVGGANLALPPSTESPADSAQLTKQAQKAKIGWAAYMQSDNNLWAFAQQNVAQMVAATFGPDVACFIEWDKPTDNETWRLQIVANNIVDAGSFIGAHDLGYDPRLELIDMFSWFKNSVEAPVVIFDLWNHGSGVIDPTWSGGREVKGKGVDLRASVALSVAHKQIANFSPPARDRRGRKRDRSKKIATQKNVTYPLVSIPGKENQWPSTSDKSIQKGILFDDTQNTYLTTEGMKKAFASMKSMLGRPLDIILFDACLMSMIEVVYQLNGLATFIVASENTVPGNGLPYNTIFDWLGSNSNASARDIAKQIVILSGEYYNVEGSHERRTTFAVTDVAAMDPVVANLKRLVSAINSCNQTNRAKTYAAIKKARMEMLSINDFTFDVPMYVDLKEFYNQIIASFKSLAPVSDPVLVPIPPIASPAVPDTDKTIVNEPSIQSPATDQAVGDGITITKAITVKKPIPKQAKKTASKTAKKQNTGAVQKSVSVSPPLVPPANLDCSTQAQAVIDIATTGLNLLSEAIIMKAIGPDLPDACGMTIYYPQEGPIDALYPNTDFAKKTGWDTFITKYF